MKFNQHPFLANAIKIPRRKFFRLAAGAVALPALSRRALALDYPTRPVRFISGFPAGGPVDIATRVMADWFSSDLGQQFVVGDRGGMGGNLGTQAMINSPPDGYTLQLVGASNAISASLYKTQESLFLFTKPSGRLARFACPAARR